MIPTPSNWIISRECSAGALRQRTRRWLRLGAVLLTVPACLLWIGAGPAAARGPSTITPSGGTPTVISGMNGWSLYPLTPSQLSTQLARMQAAGVTTLRVDASWSSIEPSNGTWSWSAEDAEATALAQHHITWLPVLDYSAPWAASIPGDWRSPPANDSQYATFAAAVAARYGANGTFWRQNPNLPYEPVPTFEVWNEENTSYFWDTGPNPPAYALLYTATRTAIDAVDRSAQVIVGGLTNPTGGDSANDFVWQMFKTDPSLVGRVDGFGLHPYADDASDVIGNVVLFRDTLDAAGESSTVPIDVTEFGWESGDAAEEQWRANMMENTAQILANSNCGISLLAPYDWLNPPGVSGGDWGLADQNGLRASGTAWFAGLKAAAELPTSQLCPTSKTRRAAHQAQRRRNAPRKRHRHRIRRVGKRRRGKKRRRNQTPALSAMIYGQ